MTMHQYLVQSLMGGVYNYPSGQAYNITCTRHTRGSIERKTIKMMKVVLLLFSVLAMAAAAPAIFDPELDQHWVTFAKTYGKVYKPEEETFRRVIWEKNLRTIRQHNLEADMGLHTFTMGINEHADLSDEEFRVLMKGYTVRTNSTASSTYLPPSNTAAPSMMDWRKHGYVTPVKDQKQCGSCWAFSSTGSLEGQHFKKTGKLVSLSEQDLVDCSRAEGNLGCGGGNMDNAFDYIKMKGIATEAEYPYKAVNEKCKRRMHKMKIGATCTGHVDIESGSEAHLLSAASTVGPISVAIDASTTTFRFYKHGVYYSRKCSSSRLDHGVLVVGYGTLDDKEYWLVKNSWGASWGDNGYIKMSRNRHNNCGIATQACYPLV